MRIITLVLLALAGLPAFAQEGIYVGLGLGSFDYEDSMPDPVFGVRSDSALSYKVYGGFEFNDYLSAEIGYGETDKIEGSVSGTDPFLGDFTSSSRTEFTTTTFKLLGQFSRDWGVLLGGLGYFDTDSDIKLSLTSDAGSFNAEGSISDNGLMAMLGIEWRFGRFGTGYGVRLEYEWLDAQEADASTIGVGVSYRF